MKNLDRSEIPLGIGVYIVTCFLNSFLYLGATDTGNPPTTQQLWVVSGIWGGMAFIYGYVLTWYFLAPLMKGLHKHAFIFGLMFWGGSIAFDYLSVFGEPFAMAIMILVIALAAAWYMVPFVIDILKTQKISERGLRSMVLMMTSVLIALSIAFWKIELFQVAIALLVTAFFVSLLRMIPEGHLEPA